MHINKLVFMSCSGNKAEYIDQMLILGTTFRGQGSQSTALEILGSTGIIEDSSFQLNFNTDSNLKNLTVKDWTGEKIQTSHAGGALSVTGSNLTIVQSTFKRNGAEVGGALFCELGSTITILNTTFALNQATSSNQCYGGAILSRGHCKITVTNCTFYKNRACRINDQGGGGAIAALDGTELDIRECVLTHSEAEYGGAVLAWKATVAINETVFHSNKASLHGGATCVWESNITFNMCIFNDNRALIEGGALQIETATVNIIEGIFNRNDALMSGGAMSASDGHVNVHLSIFNINKASDGGAISTYTCNLYINESEFFKNSADHGGAVNNNECTSVNIAGCKFIRNAAYIGGGVNSLWSKVVNIIECEFIVNEANYSGGGIQFEQNGIISMFVNNTAKYDGGATNFQSNTTLKVTSTTFESNVAYRNGGAIIVQRYYNTTTTAIIEISNSTFSKNTAEQDGGAVSIDGTSIFLTVAVVSNSDFDSNEAENGGAIYVQRISLSVKETSFSENSGQTGIVYTTQSAVSFSGETALQNNTGSVFLFSSNLTVVEGSNARVSNNIPSQQNQGGIQQGGALTAVQSNIVIYGACTLTGNNAKIGGAIYAIESKILIYGEVRVSNNTARVSGGGVYLYQSELKCSENGILRIQSNTASEKGGGIHAISSLIISELMERSGSLVLLSGNYAKQGGGICMEVNAKMYILKLQYSDRELTWWNHRRFILSSNSAHYGAAVYISDDTNFATCASTAFKQYSAQTECFMQVLALHGTLRSTLILDYVNFTNNIAQYSGSNIFGGLLDRCTVSPYAEIYSKYDPNLKQKPDIVNGVTFITTVSTIIINTTRISISSEPVQICFCENGRPNCDLKQWDIATKKGYVFEISLVAIDQVNQTVNATIRSSLSSIHGGLDEDQASQYINSSCSTLKFSVFSPRNSEKLTMYAEGPCKDAKLSQKQIDIQFLPCTCPIGFQTDGKEVTRCMCECDAAIRQVITECNERNKTVAREGTFWITYLNTFDNTSERNYLIYPYCPFDYCHPPTLKIHVKLSDENGPDGQCNFNRSGILCGRCKQNFSLSLGSSHCVPCSKDWPVICALIVAAAILAGIALVALLLMLNLTVAAGTINGIIFYANVINANTATFFSLYHCLTFLAQFRIWI